MSRKRKTEEGQQMMEARREAEEFVMRHRDLLKGASKDEINSAIGKIGKALWELKIASRDNANRGMV